MAANGTYMDPATRHCFSQCKACSRCNARGSSACPYPNSCSGRPDREGKRDPHQDDLCQCNQGVMRWVTKEGRLIIRKYMGSPFTGEVKTDAETPDERDWNEYLSNQRELRNDEFWDPITYTDTDNDMYRRNNRGVGL